MVHQLSVPPPQTGVQINSHGDWVTRKIWITVFTFCVSVKNLSFKQAGSLHLSHWCTVHCAVSVRQNSPKLHNGGEKCKVSNTHRATAVTVMAGWSRPEWSFTVNNLPSLLHNHTPGELMAQSHYPINVQLFKLASTMWNISCDWF